MQRHVAWRIEATPTSMGMHHYEQRIQAAIAAEAGDDWTFSRSTVGSLRRAAGASVRFPAILRERGPRWLTPALRRGSRRTLVHRFDLRLPPAPREVVTVHDLPPRRFPDEGRLPDWCLESARRAREVIVPSEFARNEVATLTGAQNITVIPYGLSPEFQSPEAADADELAALGITGPFVVHAAGATRRKNLDGLADAWRRITAQGVDHTLVLCGPPHPARDRAFDGLPQVLKVGRQPLATVTRLMAASSAVVVPSTYEGFGLPALEGLACSVPVVAADRGALPEVCDGAAVLVEPDGEGLASGVSKVIDLSAAERADVGAAGRRRAESFDWSIAARQHLDVYLRHP